MVIEHKFYQLLSQIVIHAHSISQEKSAELHNELIDLVMRGAVTPTIVVQSFASVFAQEPSGYLGIILTMDAVYITSKMNKGYLYPEFFWIIEQNDVFSRIEDIGDIVAYTRKFCDREILRAHLSFLLMTSESRYHKHIIYAFYYVGHTVETLKLVLETVPINQENLSIYDYTYSCAMSMLFSSQAVELALEDKDWLQEFFTKGLLLAHERITESCQAALKKLAE